MAPNFVAAVQRGKFHHRRVLKEVVPIVATNRDCWHEGLTSEGHQPLFNICIEALLMAVKADDSGAVECLCDALVCRPKLQPCGNWQGDYKLDVTAAWDHLERLKNATESKEGQTFSGVYVRLFMQGCGWESHYKHTKTDEEFAEAKKRHCEKVKSIIAADV